MPLGAQRTGSGLGPSRVPVRVLDCARSVTFEAVTFPQPSSSFAKSSLLAPKPEEFITERWPFGDSKSPLRIAYFRATVQFEGPFALKKGQVGPFPGPKFRFEGSSPRLHMLRCPWLRSASSRPRSALLGLFWPTRTGCLGFVNNTLRKSEGYCRCFSGLCFGAWGL